MNLLPGEKTLLESSDQILTLTTHRIRYEEQKRTGNETVSIMLNELTSCSTKNHYEFAWIFASAYAFLIVQLTESIEQIAALLATTILFIGFILSNRSVLEFASAGAVIQVKTENMTSQAVQEFIDEVELAKDARHLSAQQSSN